MPPERRWPIPVRSPRRPSPPPEAQPHHREAPTRPGGPTAAAITGTIPLRPRTHRGARRVRPAEAPGARSARRRRCCAEPHRTSGRRPVESAERERVEEAERWGDEELQSVPRRIMRWGLVRDVDLRRWLGERSNAPAPAVAARLSGLNARYYAWLADADEAAVRRDLAELPSS